MAKDQNNKEPRQEKFKENKKNSLTKNLKTRKSKNANSSISIEIHNGIKSERSTLAVDTELYAFSDENSKLISDIVGATKSIGKLNLKSVDFSQDNLLMKQNDDQNSLEKRSTTASQLSVVKRDSIAQRKSSMLRSSESRKFQRSLSFRGSVGANDFQRRNSEQSRKSGVIYPRKSTLSFKLPDGESRKSETRRSMRGSMEPHDFQQRISQLSRSSLRSSQRKSILVSRKSLKSQTRESSTLPMEATDFQKTPSRQLSQTSVKSTRTSELRKSLRSTESQLFGSKKLKKSTSSMHSISSGASLSSRKSSHTSTHIIKPLHSAHRRMTGKSLSNISLRRTPSRIKRYKKSRKSKKKIIVEFEKQPGADHISIHSDKVDIQDLQYTLDEPAKMYKFVQQMNVALKAFHAFRKAFERTKQEEKFLAIRKLQEAKYDTISTRERENMLSMYLLKRLYPFEEDTPTEKRVKYIMDDISSGSSSESYLEWKSKMMVYQELSSESSSDSSKTESASSIEFTETESSDATDEKLQHVYHLGESASASKLKAPSAIEHEETFKAWTRYSRLVKEKIIEDEGEFVNPMTGSPIAFSEEKLLDTPGLVSTADVADAADVTGAAGVSVAAAVGDAAGVAKADIAAVDGIAGVAVVVGAAGVVGPAGADSAAGTTTVAALDDAAARLAGVIGLEENEFTLDESLFNEWDKAYADLGPLEPEEETRIVKAENTYFLFVNQAEEPKQPVSVQFKEPDVTQTLGYIIEHFLDALITRCVFKVENLTPLAITARFLCKRKLINSLDNLLKERQEVQEYNQRLQSKVVLYFYRRRKFSHLTDVHKIEYIARQLKSYTNSCERLDRMVLALREARAFYPPKIEQEKKLHDKCKKQYIEAIDNLESFIRKTIVRDPERIQLSQFVDSQLKKMATARQELCECIYKLIDIQHIHCDLKKKFAKFTDIGDGKTLMDCQLLEYSNEQLRYQNAEKEEQLKKWRKIWKSHVGMVSHFRELNSVSRLETDQKRLELDEQKARVYWLRQKINYEKSKKQKLREMTSEFKWESGLLFNEALLNDCVETDRHISELRQSIQNWQHQSTILNVQLNALEQK